MHDFINEYLTLEEVASIIGITVGSLKNRMYSRRNHPPYVKGINRFHKDAFSKWLRSCEVSQLSRPQARR